MEARECNRGSIPHSSGFLGNRRRPHDNTDANPKYGSESPSRSADDARPLEFHLGPPAADRYPITTYEDDERAGCLPPRRPVGTQACRQTPGLDAPIFDAAVPD